MQISPQSEPILQLINFEFGKNTIEKLVKKYLLIVYEYSWIKVSFIDNKIEFEHFTGIPMVEVFLLILEQIENYLNLFLLFVFFITLFYFIYKVFDFFVCCQIRVVC